MPVAQPPTGRRDVRDQDGGFSETRLVYNPRAARSSFAAQATPVHIHNPHNGHIRHDHHHIGSGVVGHNRFETPRLFH